MMKLLIFMATVTAVITEDHVGYKFEYGVHDPHTKDHKSHYEHRDGHHVIGSYTLQEPDGTHRTVHYKAGPHSGFEAIVEKSGHAHHPEHNNPHKESGISQVGTVHWGNQESKSHEK